ncbi:recombinase family protein [Clostridium sp. BSD9I1]|uniref:recombinase family protein n=1 Tax=Clostridium sp. BSD9I1 TaxID=2003589 RepID=UPI001647C75B|nr:recombinase family protein [Clostridium sp. BSD9I1]
MISNPENYAAIYARSSTKSDKNTSVETQESKGEETALKNNLLIYNYYSEKISVTEIPYMEREKFMELIEDAKAGYFKTLIVFRSDRLARNTLDAMKIKRLLKNLGVKILYSSESEYNSDGTPNSDFIGNIMSAVAELESKTIKERTESGKKKQRQEQEHSASKAAYGFVTSNRLNKKISRYITYYDANDSLKDFIDMLFTCYISNKDLITDTDIYNFLKKNNINIPLDFNKEKIRSIICNPIYASLQTKNIHHKFKDSFEKNADGSFSHIDEDFFQPAYNVATIVDDKTFFAAANKWYHYHDPFGTRARNTNYLLKDLLYCGKCGNKVTLSKKIYSCKTTHCTRLNEYDVSYEVLNNILESLISNENFSTELDLKIQELKRSIVSKNNKLIQFTRKQENLVKTYLNKSNDKFIINALEENVNHQDSIKDDIKFLKSNIIYYENMKNLSFSEFNKASKNALIYVMLSKNDLTRNYLLNNIEKVILYGRNPVIEYK